MLTPHRRLRYGRSLWSDEPAPPIATRPFRGVLMADVVVVGSGISGALMMHLLTAQGHAVTMIDDRAPVTGSTRASTALIQFEIDQPLSVLTHEIGTRRAVVAWQRSRRAVRDLSRLVQRARIPCAFEPRRSLYLAGDVLDADGLATEYAARRRAGLPGQLLSADQLRRRYGLERAAAILSPGNASCNPVQLTSGLLARAVRAGVPIMRPVRLLDIEESRSAVVLHCDHDRTIVAQQVVLCTGYEVPVPVPNSTYALSSTWALAGTIMAPTPSWLRRMLVWEASDPYLYLRLAGGDTLIAGGRDERDGTRYTDRARMAIKLPALRDDIASLLPTLRWQATHAWSGVFGTTPTGLPIIDRLPKHRRTWSVSGFGGNGITYSMIAAQIVSRALGGHRDADAWVFALPRRTGT